MVIYIAPRLNYGNLSRAQIYLKNIIRIENACRYNNKFLLNS